MGCGLLRLTAYKSCRGAHNVGREIQSARRPQKLTGGPRLGKLPTDHIKHNQLDYIGASVCRFIICVCV